MVKKISVSVHGIVDIILRKGHLDTRVFNQASMVEGSKMHAQYQNMQDDNYIAEYSLSDVFQSGDYVFDVSGKADGVIAEEDGSYTVEEIKTTVTDLKEYHNDHGEWHLGQAKFYAYMLAKEKNLKRVKIRLTYLKQGYFRTSLLIEDIFSYADLQEFVNEQIERFRAYIEKVERYKEERDRTCKDIPFPYKYFRAGQEEMIDAIRCAMDEERNLFVEAPTGLGKTLASIFPMVRRFGEGEADRVLYLTSKNSIKRIAVESLNLFNGEGARLKSIEFTSQDTICFNDRIGHCNPDECPFAKNYYDKLLDAIFEFLDTYDTFSREKIIEFCSMKELCPFQFQLDLSRYCDFLICDYTYVFDYLDRLCMREGGWNSNRSYLLIDECHNLPDRVRDMYSSEIHVSFLEESLSLFGESRTLSLKKTLENLIDVIRYIPYSEEDENYKKYSVYILDEKPERLFTELDEFLEDFKALLRKQPKLVDDKMREVFFVLNKFMNIYQRLMDLDLESTFILYIGFEGNRISYIRLSTLDPKPLIADGLEHFNSSVFFSATLSPKNYFMDLLGKKSEDQLLVLPSSFPKENRCVHIDLASSLRYKDRDETLLSVYARCLNFIKAKKGNYLIFCPSFQYLSLLNVYFENDPEKDYDIILQQRSMTELEREQFLDRFAENNERTTLGLVVLGGMFSEGIDLFGEKLIGAIIISVGIPQVSFERDQLKSYYDKIDAGDKKGFSYAYSYPGLNRVLQAAGRVIRSENDKGALLFIDSRYRYTLYQEVFKELYPDARRVISGKSMSSDLYRFWKEDYDGL